MTKFEEFIEKNQAAANLLFYHGNGFTGVAQQPSTPGTSGAGIRVSTNGRK